jgi:membrane fusion protein (multidrug efflux system)
MGFQRVVGELRRSMAVLALGAAMLSGCGGEVAPAPPPMPVEVVKAAAQDTPLYSEYIGDIRAGREVAVFPRIGGVVLRRGFVEGSLVREGQVLFEIEAREYVSARDVALANVAAAEAQAARAGDDVARYEPLVAADAIARQVYDNAIATSKAAAAQVKATRAALRNAEITLGYGQVRAPISGRIGKASASVGQLVAPGGGELARISDASRIEVYFSPSEEELLGFARLSPQDRSEAQTGIKLVLADGSVLPQTGTIDFADRAVDPATGSYRLRAIFPNPGGQVLPGQFGRVQIKVQTRKGAVVVPDRAVIEQFGAYFVMVVGKDNIAEQRPVKVGTQAAGQWIIEDGLKPGEAVIVEGLAKVRPGMAVQPLPPGGSKAYAQEAMKKAAGKQ